MIGMALLQLLEHVHGHGPQTGPRLVSSGDLVLVAGTVTQALPQTGMGVLAMTRISAGGGQGHLRASVSGTTLTVTSSDNTETSTVNVLMILP